MLQGHKHELVESFACMRGRMEKDYLCLSWLMSLVAHDLLIAC